MNLIPTQDNSYTLYSKEYDEYYHSSYDGALSESLYKHVIPAFAYHKEKQNIKILDICYGLGYNTLATIYYNKINKIDKKLQIISPELDEELVKQLVDFEYPKEFESLKNIVSKLSSDYEYHDSNIDIKIVIGDAREYLKDAKESFDILYQDAFSPSVNPSLWTKEYFADIVKNLHDKSIITTYSTSTNVRLSMYENGINIYQNRLNNLRDGTIGLMSKSDNYEMVDMELKKTRNTEAKALID
jgi:tRNA U34 5-methylaminomethyl-2-thiouridine-forming methyltransferase MnmC